MELTRKLEVLNMLDNPLITKAAYTWRYSSSRLNDPENLSTHIYEVQMIGLFLIDKIKRDSNGKEEINREEFLMKALFHDADETIIGDTPRPLKYASPGIKEEIDQVAHRVAENLFQTSFSVEDREIGKYYHTAKIGKTGILVRLSDMLCVVKKLRVEVEKLNNYTFLDVITNTQRYVKDLDNEDTYKVFTESSTREFIFHIFHELREYLDYMADKYL